MIERSHRINNEINTPRVHLIMNDGSSKGVIPIFEALTIARQENLDLVEISPKANPPVVRLLDYNRYRYEQEKRARQSTKGVKTSQMKEMRLGFLIGTHDLEVKAKRAREFLDEGHLVRPYVQLKGRQNLFPDRAKQTLAEFLISTGGEIEQPAGQVGNRLSIVIKPKKA